MDPVGANPSMVSPTALNAVERYDGRADAHAWLKALGTMAGLYGWSDQNCLLVANVRMSGMAQIWLQSRNFANWTEFQEAFLRRFGETRETAMP